MNDDGEMAARLSDLPLGAGSTVVNFEPIVRHYLGDAYFAIARSPGGDMLVLRTIESCGALLVSADELEAGGYAEAMNRRLSAMKKQWRYDIPGDVTDRVVEDDELRRGKARAPAAAAQFEALWRHGIAERERIERSGAEAFNKMFGAGVARKIARTLAAPAISTSADLEAASLHIMAIQSILAGITGRQEFLQNEIEPKSLASFVKRLARVHGALKKICDEMSFTQKQQGVKPRRKGAPVAAGDRWAR